MTYNMKLKYNLKNIYTRNSLRLNPYIPMFKNEMKSKFSNFLLCFSSRNNIIIIIILVYILQQIG